MIYIYQNMGMGRILMGRIARISGNGKRMNHVVID